MEHSTKGWSKSSMDLLAKASKGNEEAQCELGLRLLHGEDVPKNPKLAIEWLVKSSKKGYEDAQYLLGTCYASGTGVAENEQVALGYFIKSAQAANKYAQHELGEHYFLEKKYDLAVDWYRKASRQEHAPSQYELGRCYYMGFGSIKAEDMGIELLKKAAGKNYGPAQDMLKKIESNS